MEGAKDTTKQLQNVAILSIEGNIAAGKSTQMKRLQEAFCNDPSVVFVAEPVDEWTEHGLLQDMYDGTIDRATFQMAVIMSLTVPLISAVYKPGVKLIISERSPSSNALTFAELNLEAKDMKAYRYVFEKSLKELSTADLYMAYLQLPVEQAVERMCKRARKEETGRVSKSYLTALHDKHESLLERVTDLKGKTIVDASRTEDEIFESLKNYVCSLLIVRGDDF
jgi:deoxyguanosine kinase